MFTDPAAEGNVILYVGANGALRAGRSIAESYSIGNPQHISSMYNHILNAEMMSAVIHTRRLAKGLTP